MAIYRGPGGSGDATTDAANQASVASDKAAQAASSATAAAGSATSAATSASDASTSAIASASSATSATNSATSATNSATAAAASYDSFDDRYLGAKSSDPSTDNDGDALVVGALYFNTTTNIMMTYTGSAWQSIATGGTGLLASNNLNDVQSASTSRTNLGLGTTDSPTFSNLTLDNPAGTNDTTSFTQSISGLNILARNGNNPGIINFKRYVSGTEETSATIDQFGSFNAVSLTAASLSLKNSAGTNQYALIQSVGGALNFYSRNNTADGNITFSGLANGFPTEHVRIDSSGNVGINTNTPAEKLDVAGNIAVSGTVDGRDVAVDGTKLDGIAANADVTGTANVTAAGALMDSEVTNLAQVKAFSSADYATAAQGALADSATQPATTVAKTSSTGSAVMPSGTTAQRNGSPNAGNLRFNTTDTSFEGYDGSAWGAIGGGGGASGGGSDAIFYENGQTITTSYSITASTNAMSTGPLTVNSGVSVTVPSGSRWVVL
jgi:hypothetical protein